MGERGVGREVASGGGPGVGSAFDDCARVQHEHRTAEELVGQVRKSAREEDVALDQEEQVISIIIALMVGAAIGFFAAGLMRNAKDN